MWTWWGRLGLQSIRTRRLTKPKIWICRSKLRLQAPNTITRSQVSIFYRLTARESSKFKSIVPATTNLSLITPSTKPNPWLKVANSFARSLQSSNPVFQNNKNRQLSQSKGWSWTNKGPPVSMTTTDPLHKRCKAKANRESKFTSEAYQLTTPSRFRKQWIRRSKWMISRRGNKRVDPVDLSELPRFSCRTKVISRSIRLDPKTQPNNQSRSSKFHRG